MKKFLKYIFFALIAVLNLAIIGRVLLATDKSVLSDIVPNDALAASFKTSGDDLKLLTNKVKDEIADNGYFSAYSLVYIPEVSQIQITARYNDSVFRYLDIKESEFTFFLKNSSGDAISTSEILSDEKGMYNMRRLVFDGITVSDGEELVLTMCSADGQTEYSQITIHYAGQEWKTYRLSKAEKKILSSPDQ